MMQPPPLPLLSDSMGVEGSGAELDSEKEVKRLKKESIDVFKRWVKLLCSSSV